MIINGGGGLRDRSSVDFGWAASTSQEEFVVVARQMHATGRTAEALNLVVATTLDPQAKPLPLSRMRQAVECLIEILSACNPIPHVADASVLRCWLQTLKTFGVIEPSQLEVCLGEMNRCCLGFEEPDDLGRTRAAIKVIDGLIVSLSAGNPDAVDADRLLQQCFEFVCGDDSADVRNYLLASLEQGGTKAGPLAKRLMRVDARLHAMRTVDEALKRMRECGWTSSVSQPGGEIRYHWQAPVDPGLAGAAEDALTHYLHSAQGCDPAHQLMGLVDAGVVALEQLDTDGRYTSLLLKLRPDDAEVLLALVARRLGRELPISQAESARLREGLIRALLRCGPDEALQRRLETEWHRLVWQPGLVAANLASQVRRCLDASVPSIAQEFLKAVATADPLAAQAARALLAIAPFSTAVLLACDGTSSSVVLPSPQGLQMRCNLLGELFGEVAGSVSSRNFHLLAGCFPDQDESVRRYAQVMAPDWQKVRTTRGQRDLWLAESRSRDFKLSDQQTRVDGRDVSGDFGFGDVQALREQRFTGIRRLDLVAIALFRVFVQDGSPWDAVSVNDLDGEVRMAFGHHANPRYAALCAAAVFVEIAECCPAGMTELSNDLRRKAMSELDGWSNDTPRRSSPWPIPEAEAGAWALRLRQRLGL